jgi:hypothetical protein
MSPLLILLLHDILFHSIKITVVKSLILPVLNHLFIALPNPGIEIIKDIEAMLYTFIWKSSVNRVKKDIMQKKYQEGGLKMINRS